jgi:hypothetical protein
VCRDRLGEAASHGDHVRMRLYDDLVSVTDEQEAATSD